MITVTVVGSRSAVVTVSVAVTVAGVSEMLEMLEDSDVVVEPFKMDDELGGLLVDVSVPPVPVNVRVRGVPEETGEPDGSSVIVMTPVPVGSEIDVETVTVTVAGYCDAGVEPSTAAEEKPDEVEVVTVLPQDAVLFCGFGFWT